MGLSGFPLICALYILRSFCRHISSCDLSLLGFWRSIWNCIGRSPDVYDLSDMIIFRRSSDPGPIGDVVPLRPLYSFRILLHLFSSCDVTLLGFRMSISTCIGRSPDVHWCSYCRLGNRSSRVCVFILSMYFTVHDCICVK